MSNAPTNEREKARRERALAALNSHGQFIPGEPLWAAEHTDSSESEYWLRGWLNADRSRDAELDALGRAGYVLAMRLLTSDLVLDDEEIAARDAFLPCSLKPYAAQEPEP